MASAMEYTSKAFKLGCQDSIKIHPGYLPACRTCDDL